MCFISTIFFFYQKFHITAIFFPDDLLSFQDAGVYDNSVNLFTINFLSLIFKLLSIPIASYMSDRFPRFSFFFNGLIYIWTWRMIHLYEECEWKFYKISSNACILSNFESINYHWCMESWSIIPNINVFMLRKSVIISKKLQNGCFTETFFFSLCKMW